MRKINYPLIVSDFDGTLVKEDGTISQYTKDTIREYVAMGGKFVISTGRMPSGILPRAQELGLEGLISCGNGAVMVDLGTKEVILEGKIPLDTAISVCQKMEEMGLHIHVYDLWDFYSNMDDEALAFYENILHCKAKLVLDQPLSAFIKEKELQPYKILAMVEEKDNNRVREALAANKFPGCEVTQSSAYLVEVCNAAYSKGTAITYLSEHYAIPIEKTIAVGDQFNDLPMIETAGVGIAVKNADKRLKDKAISFEYTNEEDAIAKIIEKYGYLEA